MTKKELRSLSLPMLADQVLHADNLGARMRAAEVAKERGVVDHPTRWARETWEDFSV